MAGEMMEFPETFDEFAISYGFIDAKKVYTNGSHLIPVFRVRQWLEHISEKTQMIDKSNFDEEQYKTDLQSAYDCGYNKALSENKGEWVKMQSGDKDFPESIVCSKCKNENSHLDFNEHNEPIGKVFVTSNFCPNCGADMRGE